MSTNHVVTSSTESPTMDVPFLPAEVLSLVFTDLFGLRGHPLQSARNWSRIRRVSRLWRDVADE